MQGTGTPPAATLACSYCRIEFANVVSLHAHEYRCSQREQQSVSTAAAAVGPSVKAPAVVTAPSPLKRRLLLQHDSDQPQSPVVPVKLARTTADPGAHSSAFVSTKQHPHITVRIFTLCSFLCQQLSPPNSGASIEPTAAQVAQAMQLHNLLANVRQSPHIKPVALVSPPSLATVVRVPLAAPLELPATSLRDVDRTRMFEAYAVTLPRTAMNAAANCTTASANQPVLPSSSMASSASGNGASVTQTTSVCVKSVQPMCAEQRNTALSMYSNWQQQNVSALEAKLSVVWLGAYRWCANSFVASTIAVTGTTWATTATGATRTRTAT